MVQLVPVERVGKDRVNDDMPRAKLLTDESLLSKDSCKCD